MKQHELTITKRAMFAEIHQDVRYGKPHIFSIRYVRANGTVGRKERVGKSNKHLPGAKKYRGNVNLNHVLLLYCYDEKRHFEIHIDLLTYYNGYRVKHNY